jgi:hypothetical protein
VNQQTNQPTISLELKAANTTGQLVAMYTEIIQNIVSAADAGLERMKLENQAMAEELQAVKAALMQTAPAPSRPKRGSVGAALDKLNEANLDLARAKGAPTSGPRGLQATPRGRRPAPNGQG